MVCGFPRLAVLLCIVFAPAALHGAQAGPGEPAPYYQVTDERIRDLLMTALRGIQIGLCDRSKRCEPATEAELKTPPVLIEDARKADEIGFLSGIAQKCGLDWSGKLFHPMMRNFRQKVRLNERQLTLIAMVHGIEQNLTFNGLAQDACTPELHQRLSEELSSR
jgi:hypothetical protein